MKKAEQFALNLTDDMCVYRGHYNSTQVIQKAINYGRRLGERKFKILETCRNHWRISFQHERENVIRLRKLLSILHGSACACDDCQLVRRYNKAVVPPLYDDRREDGKRWEGGRGWV